MKKTIIMLLICILLSSCSPVTPEYVQEYIKLPETKEELIERSFDIVVANVIKTEVKWYLDTLDENLADVAREQPYHISTLLVEESTKGNIEVGQEIKVLQSGDGKTVIYSSVEEAGGYLIKGTRYILFLEDIPKKQKDEFNQAYGEEYPYLIKPLVGQYELDGNNTIEFINRYTQDLFGSLETAEEMTATIEATASR